jgi:hypothetical protein
LADIEQDDPTIGFDIKRLSGHDCLMTLFVWNRTSNKQNRTSNNKQKQTNAVFTDRTIAVAYTMSGWE